MKIIKKKSLRWDYAKVQTFISIPVTNSFQSRSSVMILALHKQTWSSLKLPNATRNKKPKSINHVSVKQYMKLILVYI